MIGCEFEAQKKGITADSLLVELYDFLSEITRLSLPYKEYIEKLKKDDADFLARINIYIEQNSKKTEKPENTNQEQKSKEQESPITRIEIVSLPELRVKGSGETNKSDKPIKQTSLKSANIAYNDDEPSITINEQKVAIPPYKNEHYLCRTMYEYKKDEAIDWSIIWEKMAGYDNTPDKPEAKKEDWHTAYDTLRAVNKRIQECVNTKDNLFIWKNKTIKRNY
jgi:hypothetical protein